MIWTVQTVQTSWPRLSKLVPILVLDDVDGPRLFTTLSDDEQLFLAYLCDEDSEVERFLLVSTSQRIVNEIQGNQLAIRDALKQQAQMWMIDVRRDGKLGTPLSVQFESLPERVLPRPSAYLKPLGKTLLRVRLVGQQLVPHRIPASVVRRAVDGSIGAVKVLIRHVLDVRKDVGRPPDAFRRYYDLPATEFAFRSFEIAFGMPEPPAQADISEDEKVLDEVARLLSTGLEWASAEKVDGTTPVPVNREWGAIVEAVSYLMPPRKGMVDSVEVGGILARRPLLPIVLTRMASERVGTARRELSSTRQIEVAYEGVVREFDKDQLTFWLRKADGSNVVHVSFSQDQYEDALLAFDSEKLVTVFAYRALDQGTAELISIAYRDSETSKAISDLR